MLSRSRVRPFEYRLSMAADQRHTKQKIVNGLLFKLRTPRRRARPDRTDRPMRSGGGCGSTFFAVVCGCQARTLSLLGKIIFRHLFRTCGVGIHLSHFLIDRFDLVSRMKL